MIEIKLLKRQIPHDKNCYCAKYPVYNFHLIPSRTLWSINLREWTWLWWSLLVTW